MISVNQAGSVRLGRQRSPDKHTGLYTTKYVRAANITPEGVDLSDLLEMDFTPRERITFGLSAGDVLLTEASGSASQVGRAALWTGEVDDCCYQNTVIRFRPHAVLSEYALIVFRHYAASGVLARAARGVGIQHLGASRFAELPFPLPPLNEQKRISDIVDRRLERIHEAESLLRSALARLAEQVREILAAAAAGKLLEQKRALTDLPYSVSPSASIARTDKLQTVALEGSLFEDFQYTGGEDRLSLWQIHPGWMWARVDEVGEVKLGRQRSPRHHHGVNMRPYLRVANVFEDRIDTSDILRMNFEPDEVEIYELKFGDILLCEGQSPELVGRPAMYRDEVPGACFQNTLIRFRAIDDVDPNYVLLIFRHYMHAGVFREIARWSTNIAHLGLKRFRALPFPLPPLEEQRRIADEAQRRLNMARVQINAVQASLDRLPDIKGELLAAAVAGELVEQNLADEPANALIERLGPPTQERALKPNFQSEEGANTMLAKLRSSGRRRGPTSDLATVLREAGCPLSLPDLFRRAGYDRDQPEDVELFYLALRSQFGRTICGVSEDVENAELEATDAA